MNWQSIAVLVIFMFFRMMCSSNSFTESKSKRCLDQCRCFKSTVDCSGTNISTRDIYNVPNKTKVLNLSNTVLTSLPNGIFSKLRVLHVLDLFNSSLSNMSKNSFKGLNQLKYLNISKNDNIPLTCNTVDSSLFNDLTQLVELRIYGTTTANLPLNYSYPNEALSKLTSLESLWIDGMSNRSLGMELTNLTKLKTLRFPGDRVGFGFCNIDTLKSDMFTGVPGITHLYIIDCGIQILESDVFTGLGHLEYLDLSDNYCLGLDQVSHAFINISFDNLSVLVLNHIYFTRMMACSIVVREHTVEGFKNLSLQELHLEYNAINSFTRGAFKILPKTLKYVSVKNNEYEPDINLLYVKEITNLETLVASYQFFANTIWAQPSLAKDVRGGSVCRINPGKKEQYRSPKRYKRNNHFKIDDQIGSNYEYSYRPNAGQTSEKVPHLCQQPPRRLPPIAPYLPPNLINLDISNSKINIPIYNFTFDSNNTVKSVNAARSILMCWEGPVYGLNKLEYLDLSSNLCTRVAPNFFSQFRALKVLLLANNLINSDIKGDVNAILMRNLTELEVLDISNNGLTYMPKKFLLSQKKLQTINLSDNQLEDFEVEIGHMGNLSLLNLSHNILSSLSKKIQDDLESMAKSTFDLAGTSLHVDITSNYIHCYCVNIDFLKWLKRINETNNSHLNVSVSHCYYEDSKKEPINNIENLNVAIDRLERDCASKIPMLIGIAVGVVILTNIIVGITVYYYRWKLRYWYYVSKNVKKVKRGGYYELHDFTDENGHELRYDVYLTDTVDDKSAKFCHEIAEHVEQKSQLRMFWSERDVLPGQSVFRTIGNAIHVCRVSIFIFSSDFCYDEMWEIAVRFCEEEALKRGRMVSFCIFIDGIPKDFTKYRKFVAETIHGFIRSNAFLEYPDDPEQIPGFWEECVKKISRSDDP